MTANNDDKLAGLFAKLIAAAPGDIELEADTGPPAANPGPTMNLVRACNGWGTKFVEPIALHGEKWFAVFEEAKEFVRTGGIVALLGDRGPGKTRMAAEITRAGGFPHDGGQWNGLRTVYSHTALYRRAMDVFLSLRDTGKKGSTISEMDVLAQLERPGLLVVDEFQERGGSEWENRVVGNLIDKRYAADRPTVLIANFTRQEMAGALSESVKSRMRENGKSFTFDWPSFRENKP
jgi:DNA replication protein DnaC